jgi:hypothetical protein
MTAMNQEEHEAFYDREIAPALMRLAGTCEANGMSFLAKVEWAPDEGGSTMSVREDVSVALRMVWWAMQAQGNADQLIWAMQRHGREHGHNSICLMMLDGPHAKAG